MADYIKRVDALKAATLAELDVDFVIEAIRNIPTADVRPVRHGRWINMSDFAQLWKCSVCMKHTRRNAPSYCPNCGAKMEVDDG